jgi:Domain of unknown function (DUF4359)
MKRKLKFKHILISLGVLFLLTSLLTNPSKPEYLDWASVEVGDHEGLFAGMIAGPMLKVSTTKTNFLFFTIYKTSLDKEGKEEYTALGVFNDFYWLKSPYENTKK